MEIEMKIIVFFTLSLIFVSCTCSTGSGVMEIKTSRIDNHIIKIVELYIEKNPKFESYIIDTEIHDVNDFLGGGILITISHYDSRLFGHGEWSFPLHPSVFFRVKGKTVYVISNLDYILTKTPQKCGCEKINFDKAWDYYFKDAIMYYVSDDGEVRIESTRPDTILQRKLVPFEVPMIK